MFKITNILNPLTGGATTTEYKWRKNKPLSKYMKYDGACVVACGGIIVDKPLGEIFPARVEEYKVMPIPEGTDRQTLRLIGYTAMTAVSFIPGYGPVIAWFGSTIITGLLQDKKKKDLAESQSYAWQHKGSPTAAQGLPMPVIYGKTRVRPTLKNRYIKIDGDKQYLYALYSIAGHKVDERTGLPNINQATINKIDGAEFIWGVSPGTTFYYKSKIPEGGYPVGHGTASFAENITINGRAIQNYGADVEWETRPGLAEQVFIEGFEAVHTNTAVSIEFEDDGSWPNNIWYMPVTMIQHAHNIELLFEFPDGLYNTFNPSRIGESSVVIYAQYKAHDSNKWLDFSYKFSEGKIELHPGVGGFLYDHAAVTRNTTKSFYVTLKAKPPGEFLDYNQSYDLRVYVSGMYGQDYAINTVKLINVAQITYGDINSDKDAQAFTYPGEPLLGIKALASGQISGDLDVQVDAERSLVWVWNTRVTGANKWVQGRATSHAWAVYDILVNGYYNSDINKCHPAYPDMALKGHTWTIGGITYEAETEAIYGCGINPEYIDYESFREWSEYLDDADGVPYYLNIVFDTFMTAWDAILRICQEGRGIIYPIGTKIYAMAYKAEEPVQLFTMGNIHMDTFIQKYMESKQKANMLEVKYWDKERHYEETSIAVRTSNWDSDESLNTPAGLTLYGTTNYNQAYATARFALLMNELLNNVISFGVDVDALASRVGDVVEVSHDTLNTGESGRVKYFAGTTANIVQLDKTVVSVAGYVLKIRHENGTIESKVTTTTNAATYQLAFITEWITTPKKYDVYSFGAADSNVKKYRIMEISRTNELMRTLTLMQYDVNTYITMSEDESDGEWPSAAKLIPPSTSKIANLLNLASNVRLHEILSQNRATGEYESSISVTFDSMPPPAPRGKWEIHVRDVDVSDINWKGTWEDDTPYDTDEKVELDGITFISLEDNNTSTPLYRST